MSLPDSATIGTLTIVADGPAGDLYASTELEVVADDGLPVAPTEGLVSSIGELVQYARRSGEEFRKAVYVVRFKDGGWRLNAKFEY